MKSLFMKEIGRWLHSDAIKIKSQRTAELIQTLTNQDDADVRGLISSEREEEDDSDNNFI